MMISEIFGASCGAGGALRAAAPESVVWAKTRSVGDRQTINTALRAALCTALAARLAVCLAACPECLLRFFSFWRITKSTSIHSVVGFQLSAQHGSGARKPRLHIVQGDARGIGDLVVRELLNFTQDDHFTIIGRQRLHSVQEALPELLLFQHRVRSL